ncbi:MAG: hypothetical protein ACKVHR_03540 [Pirellulales bacterium]|jgi:hypothetical protein
MSENPFEAQTNPYAGDAVSVDAEVDPKGLQFNLTLCLILAILGIVASCMGGCGLAVTELTQSGVFDGVNVPADLSTPSAEVLEPSLEMADATGADTNFSFEAQLEEIGRDPVVRISNVVIFLLGLVTSVVLLMGSIKGLRRKSGAPKAMCNALALAIFYKVLGIFLGILSCVISVRGMSDLEAGVALPAEDMMLLQIATWGVIGLTVLGIFIAALMAGYYVYARSVFKRSDLVAYFELK